MLVTYNSILIITALSPNLNATAPKNLGRKLELSCSICADTVFALYEPKASEIKRQFKPVYFKEPPRY